MTATFIGNEIKKRIAADGLKHKKVAEKAGYKEKVFSDMLNGRKKMDAIDIFRISQALGVTPNDLFGIKE